MSTSASNRIVTIPNGLSFLRLVGVPFFFWLIAVDESFGLAVVVLAVSGATDWLDGYLARRLNQQSNFGAILDPLVDRLYIVTALIALSLSHVLPLWVIVTLICRDIFMTILLVLLKRTGHSEFPVHFVGKAATMNLLYALPLVLLGTFTGIIGELSYIVGWAFLIWGIAMYWYGAIVYLDQYRTVLVSKQAHE